MTFEVGQTVYFVPSMRYHGQPTEVIITKVGRKWCSVSKNWMHRFDRETGFADDRGFSSPGRYWPSKDAYEAHVLVEDKWRSFRAKIDRMNVAPQGMTAEKIDAAIAALGIDLERR